MQEILHIILLANSDRFLVYKIQGTTDPLLMVFKCVHINDAGTII